MRILVFGAGGMLGHKVVHKLSEQGFDVFATIRQRPELYQNFPFYKNVKLIKCLNVENFDSVEDVLRRVQPEIIINCIGVTTRKISHNLNSLIALNSLFPHRLAQWCDNRSTRLIHFSTDCVFNGKDGFPYTEESSKTATDPYGQSKSLGEVDRYQNALTLRCSIIGREIFHHTEIVEWFLSQRGQSIQGFSNVIYSGLTTNAVGDIVIRLLNSPFKLRGLYNIASQPISKKELLTLLNEAFQANVTIKDNGEMKSNKTLSPDKFVSETRIAMPSWSDMLTELRNEQYLYTQPEQSTMKQGA